jgi:hypothetical protein
MAANGVSRYTLSAVFPLFAVQSEHGLLIHEFAICVADLLAVYRALGVGWATSLLGFMALFMLPIPWVFFKWGPAIRRKSKYPQMG